MQETNAQASGPAHDPGGSYGHQTKLSGRGKGREYNSLSQNYMNPQNSGISAHAFQGPKGRISLGRTGEEESDQCPLGRCLCPWDTGFGYQCEANLSMEEEGPLPPPPTGASFEVGGGQYLLPPGPPKLHSQTAGTV